jgi:hypothetical protein
MLHTLHNVTPLLPGWLTGYLVINTIHKSDLQRENFAKCLMMKEESLLALIKAVALLGSKFDSQKVKLIIK